MNQEGGESEPAAAAAASAAVKAEEDAAYDMSTDDEANIDDDKRSNKRRKTTGDDDLTPGQLIERLLRCDAKAVKAGLKDIDVEKVVADAEENVDSTVLGRVESTSSELKNFFETLNIRALKAALDLRYRKVEAIEAAMKIQEEEAKRKADERERQELEALSLLTKDEFEAIQCLGKQHTITLSLGSEETDNFYVCGHCDPRKPNLSGPCEYGQRGRCKEDPDGPSAEEILDLFLKEGDDLERKKELTSDENESRKQAIRLFCSHFGRCWDCSGCDYWELPWTSQESTITTTAYSTTHGAKTMIGDVTGFCTYFIVRKCLMGQEERKDAVRCMIELVSFLSAKGYLTDDEHAKQIISSIRPGLTFEPDTIQQKLCELWANDYWRTLKEEKDSKKVKTDNPDIPYVGKTLDPEMPWAVEKITSEGWLLSNYGEPTVEVVLPEVVRKLGMENMQMSCMRLVHIGNGIWEPCGTYGDEEMVCANVYPP